MKLVRLAPGYKRLQSTTPGMWTVFSFSSPQGLFGRMFTSMSYAVGNGEIVP